MRVYFANLTNFILTSTLATEEPPPPQPGTAPPPPPQTPAPPARPAGKEINAHFCIRNPALSRFNTQAFFSCRWMRLSSVYSNCRWCRCSSGGLALAGDVEVVSYWGCVLWWFLGCSSMGCHSQSLRQRQ